MEKKNHQHHPEIKKKKTHKYAHNQSLGTGMSKDGV
jgi:hypothetical protein